MTASSFEILDTDKKDLRRMGASSFLLPWRLPYYKTMDDKEHLVAFANIDGLGRKISYLHYWKNEAFSVEKH